MHSMMQMNGTKKMDEERWIPIEVRNEWRRICKLLKKSGIDLSKILLVPKEN